MQTLRHTAGRSSLASFWRHGLFLFAVFGPLAYLLFQQPIGQDSNYHDFADRRAFLGVPNILDVISGVPFLLAGIAGINVCLRTRLRSLQPAWLVFYAGVMLVSAGSAYYHWNPSNDTLAWDRLFMALGFAALFVALVTEYIDSRLGTVLLVPAVLLGLSSVIYGYWYDDWRIYFWVQVLPLLTIPVLMLLYGARVTRQGYLVAALAFYVLAKISEFYDWEVYAVTQHLFSGHTLKHLLAALAIGAVVFFCDRSPGLEK